MSARRIARELAVILLPQLPKDKAKLSKLELDTLVSRAVQMLSDYAKQCLADANAFLIKSQDLLVEAEINHPDNTSHTDELRPVPVTTGQLAKHVDLLERALHLASEALDIPHIALQEGHTDFLFKLVSTYSDNRQAIDAFIGKAKAKWKVERMVSIDRDILRLACAEAFYLSEVPINVCISEAVGLSHRFADERAARFINGVLGDLAEEASRFRRTGQFSPEPPAEESDSDNPCMSTTPI